MAVPVLDLLRQYATIKSDIDAAVSGVISSGRFILGPEVQAFEKEIATYLEVEHAIGCASGTDALQIALMAIGLRPGDEVITSPFTFVATAETIALLGGVPVFVDIDPATFAIDAAQIERAITPRTRAIIPVHLYGHPCDMDAIMAIGRAHRIPVIEDAAQAVGATYRGRKVCSMGDISCVSFYPTKNLGAYGDGGLIVTNDAERAALIRRICNHGQYETYKYNAVGVNSRLDAIQAAVLRVKLRHLDAWNEGRRSVAARYDALLTGSGAATPPVAEGCTHIYHQYTVRVPNRDAVARALHARGVGSMIYYPVPLHLQPAYAALGGRVGQFPAAEEAAREVLSLPVYPELTAAEIDEVATALRDALEPIAVQS